MGIEKVLRGPRRFIQVLVGSRQVGKTTLVTQLERSSTTPVHYASADDTMLQGNTWIEAQWNTARMLDKSSASGALLILDEVQKLPTWSEAVKKLWDQDTRTNTNVKVILLGSSSLLIQTGLTESLTGRFQLTYIPHWSFSECRDAFGWSLEQFIYFGGYPGAVSLIQNELEWKNYIKNSIIETVISRDIMLLTKINKPALLRRLFELGSTYSGQILSYQKMLGQLQDTGNTTTLAHYLELLHGTWMMTGLQKYSKEPTRQKSSSPKFQVFNTALTTHKSSFSFATIMQDKDRWGRLVESAVGAHLINQTQNTGIQVSYWREGNKEVDFVLHDGKDVIALEVKSGKARESFIGMDAFAKRFSPKRILIVGADGISIEEFLSRDPSWWF